MTVTGHYYHCVPHFPPVFSGFKMGHHTFRPVPCAYHTGSTEHSFCTPTVYCTQTALHCAGGPWHRHSGTIKPEGSTIQRSCWCTVILADETPLWRIERYPQYCWSQLALAGPILKPEACRHPKDAQTSCTFLPKTRNCGLWASRRVQCVMRQKHLGLSCYLHKAAINPEAKPVRQHKQNRFQFKC